ncbi:hypothetical protein BU26DRAFT_510355 [Trematosphaeria pertusa]|uniref:Uncharacterized protein n=1 Tax=Trematosphaeria pertusa TaxID=390896 RepID=A0A6A6HWU5_9PLEO|nr:uncharacterized protein BU26DRAFT_510355 [Trematosphaeria pertusa]KAF2242491.1 hypothetical protein BU26DRAFT_510355 [Trematosphaeria pertusa]
MALNPTPLIVSLVCVCLIAPPQYQISYSHLSMLGASKHRILDDYPGVAAVLPTSSKVGNVRITVEGWMSFLVTAPAAVFAAFALAAPASPAVSVSVGVEVERRLGATVHTTNCIFLHNYEVIQGPGVEKKGNIKRDIMRTVVPSSPTSKADMPKEKEEGEDTVPKKRNNLSISKCISAPDDDSFSYNFTVTDFDSSEDEEAKTDEANDLLECPTWKWSTSRQMALAAIQMGRD